MHRTRSQGPPEFEEQSDISAYIRQVRMEYLEQRDMADREYYPPNPPTRDRYWEERFIPRLDNPKICREAENDHYHIPSALIILV